jgi:hypothetical protein
MRASWSVLFGVVALSTLGSVAAAQEAEQAASAVPCKESACRLFVDWRSGVPNNMDRRYGNPYQFERWLLGHLQEAGYRFVAGTEAGEDAVAVRLEPEMMRAVCDRTPGTNTDMSCQTIGEVRLEILNTVPELDINHSVRIRGRCGADQLMDVERMSEYVAANIDYELHGREGVRRPSARC